jgi:hypothetical protein
MPNPVRLGAVSAVTNPASAWSWYCHWEIGQTLTYNSGYAGQCTNWAISEFHQFDGLYPDTLDPADNGNAMYWATNAAYNGWAVSSTPHVNSIAVFQPGVNGAGAKRSRRVGNQRLRRVHHRLRDEFHQRPRQHRQPHPHPR